MSADLKQVLKDLLKVAERTEYLYNASRSYGRSAYTCTECVGFQPRDIEDDDGELTGERIGGHAKTCERGRIFDAARAAVKED